MWSYPFFFICNTINLYLTYQSVFLIKLIFFIPRHLPQEKTNPRPGRLNLRLWLRLRASCQRQPRRYGCHPLLQINVLNWLSDAWLSWWCNVLFHQGKTLPKTEQKFENFVRSSFKISDKKVSNHESLTWYSVYIYWLHMVDSPDYHASEIGLCLFLSLTFLALT